MKKKTLKRPKPSRVPVGQHSNGEEDISVDLKSVLDELSTDTGKKRFTQWTAVQCPYCGENFEVHLDASEDGETLQEDCQICCRPIELNVHVEDDEVHVSVYRC